MFLFDYIRLARSGMLHHFASILDEATILGTYVHTLCIEGDLHRPDSAAVLFPTALRNKLPNLSSLFIRGDLGYFTEPPELPQSATTHLVPKRLPYIPIHPYFPSLLTAFSHIRTLDLLDFRFPSFADLCRALHSLPKLERLHLEGIGWSVLGRLPPFMEPTEDTKRTLLPNLEELSCFDLPEVGIQKLLPALGPSLSHLTITPPSKAEQLAEPRNPTDIAAALAPPLEGLDLHLTFLSWSASLIPATLGKAKAPKQPLRLLVLWPDREDPFRRQDLVDLLRDVGQVVEDILCEGTAARASSSTVADGAKSEEHATGTDPCSVRVQMRGVVDTPDRSPWWRTNIEGCFPILTKWNKLEMFAAVSAGMLYPWKD
ncbi:hypothetical protein C8T65DRAFT_745157 [Cerioporus squamosus]|nr:hypothetical protein C8T65DRAFT_745157 [Cerioporus squamosus]